jgi:hypothetical protein
MIQGARGTSFLLEAAEPIGIRCEAGWKNLDRDVASETIVASTINLSHPAGAQQREDLIRPDRGALKQL